MKVGRRYRSKKVEEWVEQELNEIIKELENCKNRGEKGKC